MIIMENYRKPKERYSRYGQHQLEMIDAVQEGLLILPSVLINLPKSLKDFLRKQGEKKFQRMLKDLEKKGVIFMGGEKIELTKKGKELQAVTNITKIRINKPEKWDHVWRLVSYDIPKQFNKRRDWFRNSLEQLGFRKIHNSLWVHPFECKEEIAVIAQSLEILPHIVFMTTDYLPNEDEIGKKFGIIQLL